MEPTTQEEIHEDGNHLNAVRDVLTSVGLGIMAVAAEVAVHCDEALAIEMIRFAGDVLKPVIESVDAQLSTLAAQYNTACAEVRSLEALLEG